jgi:hypothetical protein
MRAVGPGPEFAPAALVLLAEERAFMPLFLLLSIAGMRLFIF